MQHKSFCKYLNSSQLTQAKGIAIQKARATRKQMKWRTKDNKIDCAIFVMRHLETYMGKADKGWTAGDLKEEGVSIIYIKSL